VYLSAPHAPRAGPGSREKSWLKQHHFICGMDKGFGVLELAFAVP
jgi:hypothetical protein